MSEEKARPAFVPLYRELIPVLGLRFGAAGAWCFVVMAHMADYRRGWTVSASLRDLAAAAGMSVNTFKKTALEPMARAGLIDWQSADRKETRIKLLAMTALESGQSVSIFDTAEKNKAVSKIDTDGFLTRFPQFVVKAGARVRPCAGNSVGEETEGNAVCGGSETAQTVSNFDTDAKNDEKSVSNADTVESVSNFDTESLPPHLPLLESFNNIININNITTPAKKKNKFIPSLEEVKAFFAEKNYVTDPEDFYNKNEARDWTWCDKAGKTHKIKNWKATAYEFEKRTKARGAVNFNNPTKLEERLFCWYYRLVLPALFENETARDARWWAEKGSFAFIATVAKDFERGREIILKATEQLEKGGFQASIKAVANAAIGVNEKIGGAK